MCVSTNSSNYYLLLNNTRGGESKNWMPKQPVSKKEGLLRHPVSPKGVLLRLKIKGHPNDLPKVSKNYNFLTCPKSAKRQTILFLCLLNTKKPFCHKLMPFYNYWTDELFFIT